MDILVSYVAALVPFIVLDLVWIKLVMRPVFSRALGDLLLEDPRIVPALAFFVVYQAGILYLAVLPAVDAGAWHVAALHGGLLGLIAYGTYETTNLATLKHWTLRMLVLDIGWGVASSVITAVAGFLVIQALTG